MNLKLTIATLFALLLVPGFQTVGQDRHWLSYDSAIELEGKITEEWKYGPPNFGENPKTDAKVRVAVLILSKPVSVRGKPQDPINTESVEGIRRIQLHVFDLKTPLKQFIGRRVVVNGTLFHAHTGGHYTDVVMDIRSIKKRPSRWR